jgi:hypothetical protein
MREMHGCRALSAFLLPFLLLRKPADFNNRFARKRSGDGFLPTTLKRSLHGRQHPEILLERHISGIDRICRHFVPGLSFWQYLNRFFQFGFGQRGFFDPRCCRFGAFLMSRR